MLGALVLGCGLALFALLAWMMHREEQPSTFISQEQKRRRSAIAAGESFIWAEWSPELAAELQKIGMGE